MDTNINMEINIDVSVIIPCTDRIIGLEKSINSVLNQNYDGVIELILVENNSRDRRLVENLLNKIGDVRVNHFYLDDCSNANVARNFGHTVSKGKYIAYLDSDDWWDKSHLKNSLNNFGKDVFAVYSGYILNNGHKDIVKKSYNIMNGSPYSFLFGSEDGYAQTSSYVLLKKVFDLCRWDNELNRNQDYDFFINVQNTFGWKYNENITSHVYWEEGKPRKFDPEAYKIFYAKHKSLMNPSERALYIYRVLRDLVFVSKNDFDEFKKEIIEIRYFLSIKNRSFTYNFHLTKYLLAIVSNFKKIKLKM
jgi:glycosyltransferase involved in cell wall biosynthesis